MSPSLSNAEDSIFYLNPGYHIAKGLFENKIVLMGDFDHHQPSSYHYLYDVLINWLQISGTEDQSTNLTCILEMDKQTIRELKRFIATDDLRPLIDIINPVVYLEDLEYFETLRHFSLSVDSINQSRTNKLSITYEGFEDNDTTIFHFTRREHELWFVNERDSLLSDEIMSYVNSNPKRQILVYYGVAHLNSRRVQKNRISRLEALTDRETEGYFLAHFLKNEFGKENVAIFSLWDTSLILYLKSPNLKVPYNTDFILKSTQLDGPDSIKFGADYFYSVHSGHIPLVECGVVCSRFILQNTVAKINRYKYWLPLPNPFVYGIYRTYLENVFLLTGMKFENDTLLNEWYTANSNFDEVDWLFSNRLGDTLLANINRYPKQTWKDVIGYYYHRFFSRYGISSIVFNTSDTTREYLEKWKLFDFSTNVMNLIKFTNSIGIYWIGEPDEKEKAKKYLIGFSGQVYQEPEQYLQWYRKHILRVDY